MQRVEQDPKDPVFIQNPYPFYDVCRAHGQVVDWLDYGMPAAVSHDAVTRALRDRKLGRVPPGGFQAWPDNLADFGRTETASLLNLEGPDHTRLRRGVLGRFTSGRVEALRAPIRAMCNELIANFPAGPFDLVPAFCEPVPVRVICELLGVETEAGPQLLDWSHAMVRMYQPAPSTQIAAEAEAASTAFLSFLEDRLYRPDGLASEGLLAALRDSEAEGALTHEETLSTAVLLLNAGHEATVHALGNAVVRLLAQDDPVGLTPEDRVAATVEECLRIDPPLHIFTRWAQSEVTIGGVTLQPGDQIACLLGAANRDPVAYADPDLFRPGRSGPTLTTFGGGVHFCIGAPLARLEMQIALSRLFDLCPHLRLSEPPRLADIYHFHGHGQLMVEL